MSLKVFLNLPASYLVQHMLGVVVLQFCVYNHRNLHLLDDLWPSRIKQANRRVSLMSQMNSPFTFHYRAQNSPSLFIYHYLGWLIPAVCWALVTYELS